MKIRNKLKNRKGITLIALVITIILLLILAGVSIAALTGQNGLLTRANEAKEETEQSNIQEEVDLLVQGFYMERNFENVTDYLKNKLGEDSIIREFSSGKTYFKYKDYILVSRNNRYNVNYNPEYTLVNNEDEQGDSTLENGGFLIDINQGGIPRKHINSIKIQENIPDGYSLSYDVSEAKDGTIMLYAVGDENNGYDVSLVSDGQIKAPKFSNRLFYFCNKLTELDLSNLNTSNATSIYGMFQYCSNLTNLNFEKLDTSKVENMGALFYGDKKITELNLQNFDTRNVVDMTYMFGDCTELKRINVGDLWEVNDNVDVSNMFYNCGVDEVTYSKK